jgi:hypothetical protein
MYLIVVLEFMGILLGGILHLCVSVSGCGW